MARCNTISFLTIFFFNFELISNDEFFQKYYVCLIPEPYHICSQVSFCLSLEGTKLLTELEDEGEASNFCLVRSRWSMITRTEVISGYVCHALCQNIKFSLS
mmetsp:Transcript_23916/g.47575  ORF Transcript_23916/g.47575 Transcript_23916/m.47575 type:complete len:102 (-) Transcript_23916:515-820(-)